MDYDFLDFICVKSCDLDLGGVIWNGLSYNILSLNIRILYAFVFHTYAWDMQIIVLNKPLNNVSIDYMTLLSSQYQLLIQSILHLSSSSQVCHHCILYQFALSCIDSHWAQPLPIKHVFLKLMNIHRDLSHLFTHPDRPSGAFPQISRINIIHVNAGILITRREPA